MKEAIRERCKAFSFAHRSDKERKAYVSASWRALPIIAMLKPVMNHASLSTSFKSDSKSVYSLCSIAGSVLFPAAFLPESRHQFTQTV